MGVSPFSALELTVVWMMLIVAVGIPSMGLLQFLLPSLVALQYFATTENDWSETLHPHVPEWLVVTEPHAVTDFYEGISPGESVPWMLWLKPLTRLGSFRSCLLFHNALPFHNPPKTVVERERFSFPLIQIPVQLAAEPARGTLLNTFFKNRLLWAGMILPVVLHLINGLHAHFPEGARDSTHLQYLHRLHRETVAYTWMVARDAVRHLFFGHRNSLFTHA